MEKQADSNFFPNWNLYDSCWCLCNDWTCDHKVSIVLPTKASIIIALNTRTLLGKTKRQSCWRCRPHPFVLFLNCFLISKHKLNVLLDLRFRIPVSKTCGPFIDYENMSQIFMEGILKLKEGHVFWTIFTSFTKPAIVGGILLTMSVIVYYLRAKAHGQIAKVKLLKEMLYLEAKDKEFLLGNISRLAQGKELSFNFKEEEEQIVEEPDMPIDGFADRDWKYENNLARNLRLDFEHIPTTSGYTSAL